jgi:hypothetical protein
MRGSSGVIRLDVVKPDERVFPTTPSARSLQQIPSANLSLNLIIIASAAVRCVVTDGDDHVRSPEIRLECGAGVSVGPIVVPRTTGLLGIRPTRLDFGREDPVGVIKKTRTGERARVV